MFERLDADARRAVIRAAEDEARRLGSATVEEEHLLLALAADPTTRAGGLLVSRGLGRAGLLAALARETERSLAAVGVRIGDYGLVETPLARRRNVRFATSAKRALARAVRLTQDRGDRALTPVHLLVGILAAELGTVPRALEAVAVDRLGLIAAAERLL